MFSRLTYRLLGVPHCILTFWWKTSTMLIAPVSESTGFLACLTGHNSEYPPQKKSLKTSRRLHQRLIEGENKLGMTSISFVFLRSHSAGYQLLQWLVQSQISHTNTQCLEPGQLQHSAEQKCILEKREDLQLKAIWILPWVCGEVKAKGLERDRKSILCLVLEAYW